ncbi:MAG: hypothetical protein LPK45_09765, partial [Bacteroidota bacterium]|nr:hypothetical protein [Bacteroidota bacterium]MDX5431376.1 hypothetical protein [Bacteroidota bacterium]MDX5470106.1 hypothetical protein [Bacteroidota bacterium]
EHGLLTYCMLKTLKTDANILEDQDFLNVTRWFDAAENELKIQSSKLGQRQEAQPFGNASLCIGIVNDSIRMKIQLPAEKPLVTCSDASNRKTFADNLNLRKKLNSRLLDASESGQHKFEFTNAVVGDAYEVKLSYEQSKGKIKCLVVILKNQLPYYQEEVVFRESDEERMFVQIVQLLDQRLK